MLFSPRLKKKYHSTNTDIWHIERQILRFWYQCLKWVKEFISQWNKAIFANFAWYSTTQTTLVSESKRAWQTKSFSPRLGKKFMGLQRPIFGITLILAPIPAKKCVLQRQTESNHFFSTTHSQNGYTYFLKKNSFSNFSCRFLNPNIFFLFEL